MTRSANDTPEQTAVHERVRAQIGAAAEAYGTSLVHLDASALQRVVELAEPKAGRRGAGHRHRRGTHRAGVAPHVGRVIAYD